MVRRGITIINKLKKQTHEKFSQPKRGVLLVLRALKEHPWAKDSPGTPIPPRSASDISQGECAQAPRFRSQGLPGTPGPIPGK